MAKHRPSSATPADTIAALAARQRIETLGPIGGGFVHALRLIALDERLGRDPVPELAVGSATSNVRPKHLFWGRRLR